MVQCKWIRAGCLGMVLTIAGGTAWSTAQRQPQGQSPKPPYTLAEYQAYMAAQKAPNSQDKISSLDKFVVQYPDSVLTPYVYRAYYETYFAMKNYARAIEYTDKVQALGGKIDQRQRLGFLLARAGLFHTGCADAALQTPEAYTAAKDAAAEGLQALTEWTKPPNLSDDQFENQKKSMAMLFNSVTEIAESGLQGKKPGSDSCTDVLGPSVSTVGPDTFDRMIKEIEARDSQSPRVR